MKHTMGIEQLLPAIEKNMAGNDFILAVADTSLRCLWASEEALRRFPTLAMPDGIADLFSAGVDASLHAEMERGRLFFHALVTEPMGTLQAMFAPVSDGDEPYAWIVVPMSAAAQGGFLSGEAAERMVADFSNEYRTPLTIIFSTLGLMARRLEADDAVLRAHLNTINQNCYRLLRMMGNMAEVARYRSGAAKLHCRNGDLRRFFSGLCTAVSVMTSSIDIPFESELPDEPVLLSFDPQRLSTAFLNLISNACKYTRPGNSIKFRLEAQEKQVVVSVSDRGTGIPHEHLGEVFRPYLTIDQPESHAGGTGLGMALVKYIVAEHGGTVAVQSTLGEGTTVAFTLPRRVDASLPDYTAEAGADYLADRFSQVFVELSDVCRSPMP